VPPSSGLQVKHESDSISGCTGGLQRWYPIGTMGGGEGLDPGILRCEMQQ